MISQQRSKLRKSEILVSKVWSYCCT